MHDRKQQINILLAIGNAVTLPTHIVAQSPADRTDCLSDTRSTVAIAFPAPFAVETGPSLKSLSCLHPAVIGQNTRPSTAEPSLRQRFLLFPSLSPSRRDAAKRPGIPRQRCRFSVPGPSISPSGLSTPLHQVAISSRDSTAAAAPCNETNGFHK
jgi:hypothetical protein